MRFPRPARAFTLLELVVVIVILGILAFIAVPTFSSVIARSADSSAESTLRALEREGRALAAFDSRTVVRSDYAAAAGDLTLKGAPATTADVATDRAVGVKTSVGITGLSLVSSSGNCVLLRSVGGSASVSTASAGTCSGARAWEDAAGLAAGPDLVVNGSFEAASPVPGAALGGGGSLSRTSELSRYGTWSLVHTASSSGQQYSGPYFVGHAVTPGRTYTASVDLRSSDGTPVNFGIEWKTGTAPSSSIRASSKLPYAPTPTGSWERRTITAVAPADAVAATLLVYSGAPVPSGSKVYLDGLSFHAAFEPVPYAP